VTSGRTSAACFLDSSISSYEDRSPEQNGGRCFYQPEYLIALVEGCGWKKAGSAVTEGPIIGDSFVFRPV
jgi:hypothetical protein